MLSFEDDNNDAREHLGFIRKTINLLFLLERRKKREKAEKSVKTRGCKAGSIFKVQNSCGFGGWENKFGGSGPDEFVYGSRVFGLRRRA